MANLRLPLEERNLTPAEVEVLDARRRRGQLAMTIAWQTAIISGLVGVLWVGQDLTHSPGWQRPIFYWSAFLGLVSLCCFVYGVTIRRGSQEFISY